MLSLLASLSGECHQTQRGEVMKNWNIVLGGVGGQGLVLMTKIISDAALYAGRDAKSNDVIGLSQRGGKIWGSVRIGDKIHSPNIPVGTADFLLGLEPLEALRWRNMLSEKGMVFINTTIMPPVPVIHEKSEYPGDILGTLRMKHVVFAIDANEMAKELGNVKVANTLLLGKMSIGMDLPLEAWIESIRANVPAKAMDMNIKAFKMGRAM